MTAQPIRPPGASTFAPEGPAVPDGALAEARCRHCESAIAGGPAAAAGFCCRGCEAAHALVTSLGLEQFYARRRLDPFGPALKPDEDASPQDFSAFVSRDELGENALHLMVEGLHCAACVWLIESVLARQAQVTFARLNMTTRRLTLRWHGERAAADGLARLVSSLGYRLVPYDPALLEAEGARRDRELLRAMAVAGFAAGNVMLLSIAVWAGHVQGMGAATRELLLWFSALIALPAIAYAGRPFFRSAVAALKAGRANMDVPISLAVVLAAGMSLHETATGGPHAYFDASVALLFFLLVGRYLDSRARTRARSAAERLVGLAAGSVTVEDEGGAQRHLPPSEVKPGMTVLAAAGERIAVDGHVTEGASDVDTSLITGETVPARIGPGGRVFAGALNMTGPLRVRVSGAGEATLLGEIVRLMEAAERGRARYTAIADRVARAYVPVVHALGLLTFLGWVVVMGAAWQTALLYAVAVLIVTCPCALALAVPVVQVVASGRLFSRGILLKSATALERLTAIDTVVFDKTGTLTLGRPELVPSGRADDEAMRLAASLAGASKHPLARALRRAAPETATASGVEEVPGAGLRLATPEGEVRLGSRAWCRVRDESARRLKSPAPVAEPAGEPGPELWLARPGRAPVPFRFADRLREDAATVVAALEAQGLEVEMLSGDSAVATQAVAAQAGIGRWRAGFRPVAKTRRLAELARQGKRVLMVGDGLNDAPALAAAHVSMSPSSAMDISQTAADVVFQGARLAPLLETLSVAGKADRLVRQNFALAFLYNAVTVPLAVAGLVTPLVAAIAMSASSLVVTGNALRLGRGRRPWR
jgi:Cu2+-exporting ATPase